MTATMTAVAPKKIGFEYGIMPISSLRPVVEYDEAKKKNRLTGFDTDKLGRVQVSTRFMTSLTSRFGFSTNIFDYFSHDEVFNRISEVKNDDHIRLCLEKGNQAAGFEGKLMGVSTPTKGVMFHETATNILGQYGGEDIQYSNGIVTSTHTPRSGDGAVVIAGDKFSHRYQLHTPIDGYGRPNIYLSLLRHVCTNGAIGYTKAFKSELAGGDDITATLIRALDGFDSSEGYDALRQRFDAASKSDASVRESTLLYKTIAGLHHTGDIRGQGIMGQFHKMTGDINAMYGLANIDALSDKKQRTLPVKCSTYQLLNFASELASHQTSPAGSMKLNAYVGGLLANEFDLEGTRTAVTDENSIERYIVGEDAEGRMDDQAVNPLN